MPGDEVSANNIQVEVPSNAWMETRFARLTRRVGGEAAEGPRQRERPGPTRIPPSKDPTSASALTGAAPPAEESVGFARAPMRRGALDYT